jgi:hypothetical protein
MNLKLTICAIGQTVPEVRQKMRPENKIRTRVSFSSCVEALREQQLLIYVAFPTNEARQVGVSSTAAYA